MAYIPSHQTLAGHPKMQEAARLLGIDEVTMIGHLHLLWYWAMDYAPDGNLTARSPASIAAGARWRGDAAAFVTALCTCGYGGTAGFLDCGANGSLSLHDWDDYGGKLAREKQANAARLRAHRARQAASAARGRDTGAGDTGAGDADDVGAGSVVFRSPAAPAAPAAPAVPVPPVRPTTASENAGNSGRNAHETGTQPLRTPPEKRRGEQSRVKEILLSPSRVGDIPRAPAPARGSVPPTHGEVVALLVPVVGRDGEPAPPCYPEGADFPLALQAVGEGEARGNAANPDLAPPAPA